MNKIISPLEQVEELGVLIRELHKIDSKMEAGQFIAAWRANRKLIAEYERKKIMLMSQEMNPNKTKTTPELIAEHVIMNKNNTQHADIEENINDL